MDKGQVTDKEQVTAQDCNPRIRHLTEKDLTNFVQDRLSLKEKEELLVHVCNCIYCADQFADAVAKDGMAAPKHMKETLMTAVKTPAMKIETKMKTVSARWKLIVYSLKVTAATVSALLLLLLSVLNSEQGTIKNEDNGVYAGFITNRPDMGCLKDGLEDVTKEISDFSGDIFDFANGIIQREVESND